MPASTKKSSSPFTPYYQVKTLLEWTAPGRPWRKRHKSYYTTTLLIMLFVEIILFLFSQYLLMLVVLSLVFLAFVLATVPPHDFTYRISTEGIFVEDHFFLWQELYDFYFLKTDSVDVLHIRTKSFFPGELTLTLGSMSEEQVRNLLVHYLPFREFVPLTFTEKASNWLNRTFPLEAKSAMKS